MGPGDHHCHEGQARIATIKVRDRHDTVIVQEKLDGSCVAVAKVQGEVIPLTRAGYRAVASHYFQHVLFDVWVREHYARFDTLLNEGERIVGEWLAQAHGTRYDLSSWNGEPFVAFDLIDNGGRRTLYREFQQRCRDILAFAHEISAGPPMAIDVAMERLGSGAGGEGRENHYGHHGALDPVEGAIWRVEREGRVDFITKYVRPDKVDGSYLESITGREAVWNWRP